MDIKIEGQDIYCSFSRMIVFELWNAYKGSNAEKCRHVFQQLALSLPDNEASIDIQSLEKKCSYLCKKIHEYYKKASQSSNVFKSRHSDWLSISEYIVLSQQENEKSNIIIGEHENIPSSSTESKKRGRPKKPFSECSQRSKRRRLLDLSKLDESLISSFEHDPVNVKYEIDTDEVLALVVGAKLSKHQYILIKNLINSKSSSSSAPVSLPSYQKVLKAKKKCYPQQESIRVTETSAEIELQNLLDHTTSRIIESQKKIADTVEVNSSHQFILIGKWGFDGTTGQSEYKQSFMDQNAEDCSLFITSYVPLRLVMRDVDKSNAAETVIWDNPRPASTRYCRPIRFQFRKETKELSQLEEKYIQNKINCLQPSTVLLNGKSFVIEHLLQLTMIDGKVCSALCNIASSRCFLCCATPKEMNNIDKCLTKTVYEERYEYGISLLHSWIRFFEYFIHISYRLDVKKLQMRSQEEKRLFSERKIMIQIKFREELGLIVDKPKSGGSGSSNDGNTARKFFENPAVSAEITGLKKDLIFRCSVILKVLSSGHRLSKKEFQEYAIQTAKLLVAEYPWYYLPASVHKVLVHGAKIEEYGLLSVAQLSEEPAEAKNKDVKYFREHNTRKKSRPTCNIDLLNRLLLTSDPYITGLRILPKKKADSLPSECLSLISED